MTKKVKDFSQWGITTPDKEMRMDKGAIFLLFHWLLLSYAQRHLGYTTTTTTNNNNKNSVASAQLKSIYILLTMLSLWNLCLHLICCMRVFALSFSKHSLFHSSIIFDLFNIYYAVFYKRHKRMRPFYRIFQKWLWCLCGAFILFHKVKVNGSC